MLLHPLLPVAGVLLRDFCDQGWDSVLSLQKETPFSILERSEISPLVHNLSFSP